MNELLIVPLGEIEPVWIEHSVAWTRDALHVTPSVAAPLACPQGSFDAKRGQYLATAFLEAMLPAARTGVNHVLGLTAADIFIPMLTFLFGQAQLGGKLALVSLARLRPEFYGLPPDPAITALRLRKEILHELGHTAGLVHCDDRTCVMSLSNSILQVDSKNDAYCPHCHRLGMARLNAERRKGEV